MAAPGQACRGAGARGVQLRSVALALPSNRRGGRHLPPPVCMVWPPGGLAPSPTKANISWGLVWLGGPRSLGQRHAAGAGGVEGGVNAAVAGATLGEGVLLWL